MEIFCETCSFGNRHCGEENIPIFETNEIVEENGKEYYVCLSGHKIPKILYDLISTKQRIANMNMAVHCANIVKFAYSL